MVEHAATTVQAATSAAQATQVSPTNLNVSIRILSPGDNGPVTQTNTASAVSEAVNGSGTTTAMPIGVSAPPPSPAPAPATAIPPVEVASSGGMPTSWIWNWQWSSGGCGSPQAPPTSSIAGSTWTWTWVWGCAPAPFARPTTMPSVTIPVEEVMTAVLGSSAALASTLAPAAPAASQPPANSASTEAGGPGNAKSTRERGAPDALDTTRLSVLAALVDPRGRGGDASRRADTRVAPSLTESVARAPRLPLGGDRIVPAGLATAVAATAGGGSASSTGTALGMAALLAFFIFFTPQILLPLRAASARRVRYPASRLERPG